MRISVLFLFGVCFCAVSVAQNTTILEGKITDETGGVIEKVAVYANGDSGKQNSTVSNAEGIYSIRLEPGEYKIEFRGTSGFRTTILSHYRIPNSNLKVGLDIVLTVDMESLTVMYSEFVCDKDGKKCEYISRRGSGSSKPNEIDFETKSP